ncbi:protein TolR [Halomonas elongata]|uniref:Tol-Pal system protein TolR n=1 Tax=Halomonas elongata (strain ATCC 33173 / DSM 2581 / NBRC 15536 / NCIMB 2198 / 1H9) TaxID=768066 RepID=E1VCU3_HALED|nr:protein TolR [Halomonas elongata]MBW5800756.1 protein TolR [Halomonas elongata]RAW08815.1 protein TolR [Halomonas elongata]WBF19731.1 protein TolR [Halomonas elongata]WPU48597.1 protein TolR [Halomonas elongata DSM 2581]WVI73162.1 protein TolR [Halomonas elongata]
MHGPFNRMGRRKPMNEINVVPFIDVMLVLLVIFMITAPMLTQGVEVDLPQTASQPIEDDEDRDPIIVSVDREGEYFVSLGGDETQVSLDELSERVIILLERHPTTRVLVRGDRNVSYGQVVTLMSTLQTAGVSNVGLISEPPPGES